MKRSINTDQKLNIQMNWSLDEIEIKKLLISFRRNLIRNIHLFINPAIIVELAIILLSRYGMSRECILKKE